MANLLVDLTLTMLTASDPDRMICILKELNPPYQITLRGDQDQIVTS